MVCGQASVQGLGDVFANPARQASSNYGIGFDGKIGLYVDEADRSWCSSSKANDHRAITIECASDASYPYAVKDVAYQSLIKLVADICQRNGIKKLVWNNDSKVKYDENREQNMTLHKWFADTSCPGKWLEDRMGEIAEKVNDIIVPAPTPTPTPTHTFVAGDVVKVIGDTYYNGKAVPQWVKDDQWIVKSATKTKVIVDENISHTNSIDSPFKPDALEWTGKNVNTTTTPAKPVDYNAKIKEYQTWLKKTWNYNVTADGAYGPVTQRASIRCLQRILNQLGEKLTVDGVIGTKTKNAINRHIISKGDTGNLVKLCQGLLYCNLCNCKGFDGKAGTGFVTAVKAFQKDKKLKVDGKVGSATLVKLIG